MFIYNDGEMKIFLPQSKIDTPLFVIEIGTNSPTPPYDPGYLPRPVYVLHYVVSGSGVVNGVHFKGPCAFLLTPTHIHHYTVDADSEFYEQYWIMFSGSAATEYLKDAGIPTEYTAFPCPYVHQAVSLLKEAMDIDNYTRKNESYHMLSILVELFALHAESVHPNSQKLSKSVMTIRDYIHTNYAKPITKSELAELAYTSVGYMHKIFTAEMGIPPMRYLCIHRIKCAKKTPC